MNIYFYDKEQYFYIGTKKANLDQLETKKQGKEVFLIPNNATTLEPPKTGGGSIPVFKNGRWEIVEDHRGKTFYEIETKKEIKITKVGSLPDRLTSIRPVNEFDVWDGEKWVKDEKKEKEKYDREYILRIVGKKFNEFIIDLLISEGILSDKGKILKYETGLELNIFDMIKNLENK